jgi:hypothetical protein
MPRELPLSGFFVLVLALVATAAMGEKRRAWTGTATLERPPVPLAPGVTGVVAHVPEGLDARGPLHLVLYFHGSGSCALQLATTGDAVCKPGAKPEVGAALDARHDDAGTQSIFAVPQFVLWGGGNAGRMAEKGYFASFVRELLARTFTPGLGAPRTLDNLADVTLVAHSAGHIPLAAVLASGDLADKIRNVVLIDALFDGGEPYSRWLERDDHAPPKKLVAVYGSWGSQPAFGRAIASRAEKRTPPASVAVDPRGSLEHAIRTHDVTVKEWDLNHGWMPVLLLTKLVAGLDLPPRPVAPARASAARDYALYLGRGDRVTIDVRGGPSSTEPCCTLDVVAQLLQRDRVLAQDDDGAGDFDAHLDYVAPSAGTYVLRVTTAGSGLKKGTFAVTASVERSR